MVLAALLSVMSATSAMNVSGAEGVTPSNAAVEQTLVAAAPVPGPRPAPVVAPRLPGEPTPVRNEAVVPAALEDEVPAERSCRLAGPHLPQGTSSTIVSDYAAPQATRVIRFSIEVENGLAIDGECFAKTVAGILNDPEGWGGNGDLAFQPVSDGTWDFRLVLASPGMTDRLCFPMRTGGKYSCRNRETVALNLARWESGTHEYSANLDIYRQYLVNHEVGHFLGHSHRRCPGSGELAPVMMQQTKGLGECLLNGWPTSDER